MPDYTSPIGYRRVDVSWKADGATGERSAVFDGYDLPSLSNWSLQRFKTVPGKAPADPRDNYDVEILDVNDDDVLDTKGLNRDNTAVENVPFIQSPSHGSGKRTAGKPLVGDHKLRITNAGVGAEGRIVLFLYSTSGE